MDPKIVTNKFDRDPKHSLKRVSKKLKIREGFVQEVTKSCGYKPYIANIVQELNPNNYAVQATYTESTLEEIKNSPEFVRLLLFSDEAVFNLDEGSNKLNYRYCPTNNPNWLIEKVLQSPMGAGLGGNGIFRIYWPIFL